MGGDSSATGACARTCVSVEPDMHANLRRLLEAYARDFGVQIHDVSATWIDMGAVDGELRSQIEKLSVHSVASK